MDEIGIRTLFAVRASGALRPVATDMAWTILEIDSDCREERFQALVASGLSEIDAQMQPSPILRLFTEEIALRRGVDRRRVFEHIEMVMGSGMIEIVDRSRKHGYYDVRVLHLAPEPAPKAHSRNPTRTFDFLTEQTEDASIESVHRTERPGLQREASPDHQRHRSADCQRAAAAQLAGRPNSQRGSSPDSTSLATIEAAGPDLDGSTSEAGGAPPSSAETARRFSGAPSTARRFSGAPPGLTTDDDQCADNYAQAGAPSGSRREPEDLDSLRESRINLSSSSVSQAARRKSGAPEIRRAIDGAPPIDLRQIDPQCLPWEEIRETANLAIPILKTAARQTQTRHLVLTAAIAAACLPEDLGREWVDGALQKTEAKARENRVGYFRTCLAEGLEICRLCPQSLGERPIQGMRLLTLLQKQLARAIAWYETGRQREVVAAQGGPS